MTRLTRPILLALLASGIFASHGAAEEALVTISAPADGEKLAAAQTYKVDYEVKEVSH